jgi:hypothetical protein
MPIGIGDCFSGERPYSRTSTKGSYVHRRCGGIRPRVPNCQFEIHNVTLPWTYDSEQFDLIYIREMFGSIPDRDMFFRQCWNSLRPGGYVEVIEHSVTPILDDATLSCPRYALWDRTIAQTEQASGKRFSIWRESAQLLEVVVFGNRQENL